MSSALDMSLDDLIKKNKESGDGSRGKTQRGSSSASGPSRRQPNRAANRANPYASGKPKQAAPDTQWQHDMFVDQPAMAYAAPAGQSIETGTKLYISNLDYGVSNEDIKELFSEVGDLKRFSVHYDRSGRSKGTAEVVFSRRSDAVAAVKRYNNVQLDGKPMKIDLVLPNLSAVTSIPQVTNASFGNPGTNANPRSNEGRGAGAARPRGGGGRRGRGWSGRGRGRGAGRGENLSVEDLDADLDKYHADAMQIN